MARKAVIKRGSKKGSSSYPARSSEKHTLEHFRRFAYTLQLPDDRGPFDVEGYMLDALADYFNGFFESLWLWPTGQAKSTLLGAVALHHGTYVRRNCKVMILGGLGGHGRNTLDAATGFIDRSKDLSRWWVSQEYGMGRVKSKIDRGVILVTSAGRRVGGRGGSSQEGEDPSLILVEELHRHEDNGAAVRTLTSKVQKRSVGNMPVQIVHATTAGETMDSPLGRMIERVTDIDAGAIVETDLRPGEHYRRAVDADGDLVLHEFSVPDTVQPPADKKDNIALNAYLVEVKKGNPASFVTVPNLRRMWKASSAEPWVFLRQNANQWVTQDFAALDKVGWYAGDRGAKWLEREHTAGHEAHPLEIPANVTGVFVGLDTASRWDRTAIVPVWRDPDTGRPRTVGAVILRSSHPGSQRRMRDVINVLQVMRASWPKMAIVFDRNWGGGLIGEQMEEDHALNVIDHGQGVEMELASMLLGELIDQRQLEHDGNEELTAHILAAVARRTRYGRRWRLEQPRDGRPVDGAIALAMAVHMAMQPEPEAAPAPLAAYR